VEDRTSHIFLNSTASNENIKTFRSHHITAHSPSCLCAGTPISSKVFGPLPGFAAGGFATAPAGFGVVDGEGSAGPSVRVTGFLPGTSAGPGGGREAGREEGAEVRPCGRSKAGIELELWSAGDPGGRWPPPTAEEGGRTPYCLRRSSWGAENPMSSAGADWGGGTEADGPGRCMPPPGGPDMIRWFGIGEGP
jgi:hypothetical protein